MSRPAGSPDRHEGDRDEMSRTLRLLFRPGDVVELRALSVPQSYGRARTVAGYFDDLDALADAAMALTATAAGVYVTINEVEAAVLARRKNHAAPVDEREPLTGDANVTRRRHLLVDADPVRPAGISSSDEEHELALARVREIRTVLLSEGWPEPILADSGNGGHLVFAIDLPAKDAGLVDGVLAGLAGRFGGGGVSIDVKVGNASRISKLYGTWARKGEDVPERPHRMARMLDVTDELLVVPEALLRAMAAGAKARPAKVPSSATSAHGRFDLERWIAEFDLQVDGPKDWEGGRKWVFRVCPWNAEHVNKSAWVAQLANGALSAGCQHQGCAGRGWAELRALVERGIGGDQLQDAGDVEEPKRPKQSQASTLVALADADGATFWHTAGGEAYATIVNRGHRETVGLRGKAADLWLRNLYYRDTAGGAPGGQAVGDALAVLRSRALFDGEEHEAHVRLGEYGGHVYLDLGSGDWTAVRVSAKGWEVVAQPPIKFRRPRGLLSLPEPARGGDVSLLHPFVNVADDDDFRLLVTTLVMTFFAKGPYPVVVLGGEQGSAKSTTARVLRALIDPNSAPLRAQPREERDLVIAANNGWVINFDNLSGVPTWLSDAICRLATGSGFAVRELYSDADEVLFDAQRPVIINGIDELATRGDLLDRALLFNLPAIAEDRRRPEEVFWAEFEPQRGRILGSLLDAVVVVLRDAATLDLPRLPRLADFARRGAALAPVLGWTAARFLTAYEANRASGHDAILEDSAVARAVLDLAHARGQWSGTATQLLKLMNAAADEAAGRARSWPKSPGQLSNALRRVVPNLREAGVHVNFEREGRRGRARLIRIAAQSLVEGGSASSTPSTSSTSDSEDRGSVDDPGWTAGAASAASSTLREPELDGLDDVDDEIPDSPASPPVHTDDGPAASTELSCRCQGCPACRGLARSMHLAARLQGEYLRHGRCSWCLRAGGGAQ